VLSGCKHALAETSAPTTPQAFMLPSRDREKDFPSVNSMDAKRCRDNVNRCIELAKDAKDAETQSILFEMVKGWLEAAAKLDEIKDSANVAEIIEPDLARGFVEGVAGSPRRR
jgi:hypothetical protein